VDAAKRIFVWVTTAVTAAMVLEFALRSVWPLLDDNDPAPSIEQQSAVVAALLLVALPHLVAVLGRRRNARLLKIAAAIGFTLTVVSVVDLFLLTIAVPTVLFRQYSTCAPANQTSPDRPLSHQ
jgi:hypothetical protein